MATVVEHDKRREEILERSLDVFMDEGYEDVTFQKIADRCGITRTTLYIYFKNKREIFLFSIKQFLSTLEEVLIKIATDTTISTEKVLKSMLKFILEKCEEKEYLKLIIKFHPEKITSISVYFRKDYNLVYFKYKDDSNDCVVTAKDYFKNLEDKKDYTLEELGLED